MTKENEKIYKKIENAVLKNDIFQVKKYLKNKDIDISCNENQLLYLAVDMLNFDIVKLLLNDPRVNAGDYDNRCFIEACKNGSNEIIKLLMNNPNVDISVDNSLSFILVSQQGNIEIIKLLLKEESIDPTAYSNGAISEAFYNNTSKEACLLIWQSDKVKKTLKNDHKNIYEYCLKKEMENKLHLF